MTVSTVTPGSVPYATLLSFTRYVGRTGPRKASFVGGLRRQRESGPSSPYFATTAQAML